jgi:hypothetical protein
MGKTRLNVDLDRSRKSGPTRQLGQDSVVGSDLEQLVGLIRSPRLDLQQARASGPDLESHWADFGWTGLAW